MRFRNIFLSIGTLFIIILLLITDPDTGVLRAMSFGAGTLVIIISLLKVILYFLVLHWGRKAFYDYLDLETVITKACQSSEGAGMVTISVSLLMIAMAILIYGSIAN